MFNNIDPTYLLSSTLPKRTEAMRARVLVFPAGQSEITTTIPPLTCGSIVHTAATCIMEGNWSAHFLPLPRVTPSPASWTWKLTPYLLLRMTKSVQILTVSIRGFNPHWLACFAETFACLCFPARSQSWRLKVWLPLNCTPAYFSTAVILERRCLIHFAYYIVDT